MDKKAQLTIIGAAIVLVSLVTITYAFFAGGVNNDNPQTATITTGTMELTFADNDTGVAKQMIFGESIEKKFTLENTGTVDATAYLYWKDLVNTYLEGSLIYRLEYSETANGAKTVVMNNAYVPRRTTPGEEILSQILTVPADTTYYYTLTITLVNSETIDQTADLRATFTTGFNIKVEGSNKSKETLAALGLTNQVQEEPTEYNMFDYTYNGYQANYEWNEDEELYDEIVTQKERVNTSGLYAMADDYGTSYYFRGPKTLNNIVKFGKYDSDMYYYQTKSANGNSVYTTGNLTDFQREAYTKYTNYCTSDYRYASSGNDMYWRIVRINGDGSLRLMYIGTGAEASGLNTCVGKSTFSDTSIDYGTPEFSGYTFDNSLPNMGDGTSSEIKNYLDKWYERSMSEEDAHIAIGQFFSDTTKYEENDLIMSWYLDYPGYSDWVWTAALRLARGILAIEKGEEAKAEPTLKTSITDKTYGGIYYLKTGLITADELALSGTDGFWGTDEYGSEEAYPYTTNTNQRYWSITPALMDDYGYSNVFDISKSGWLTCSGASTSIESVIPVINLTPETAHSLIGTGSTGDPYRLAE